MLLVDECDGIFLIECDCRFIVGVERRSYPELGFFARHGNLINGTWSLCVYMVASWCGISSCGCSSLFEYTCMYFVPLFIWNRLK
jgi:hypothetical protein